MWAAESHSQISRAICYWKVGVAPFPDVWVFLIRSYPLTPPSFPFLMLKDQPPLLSSSLTSGVGFPAFPSLGLIVLL